MAVHLMTTTGTETDVRAALGLAPEPSQATTPSDGHIAASAEVLPSSPTPPEPPTAAPPAPAVPAESEEDATPDQTPQEKAAQTKGRLQKRIDELVAARYKTQGELDAAQRQIAELQAKLSPPAPPPPAAPPGEDPETPLDEKDFDTYDQYLVAKAERAAVKVVDQKLKAQETKDQDARQQAELARARETLRTRVAAFAETHPDYEEVIGSPDLPNLTLPMQRVLTAPTNELGPAMAYALAKDPERFRAIAAMDPEEALQELGALRAELRSASSAPPVAPPKLPSAPPPPTPLRGSAVVATQSLEDLAKSITPGDPRTSDWLAQRNAQLAKRGSR